MPIKNAFEIFCVSFVLPVLLVSLGERHVPPPPIVLSVRFGLVAKMSRTGELGTRNEKLPDFSRNFGNLGSHMGQTNNSDSGFL